ncbi:MAG: hypothetical protein K0S01_3908 [Herbinix sp.]|jgi:hypothetical protein|nr:hypothetical protein [Herbinix sp.]
MVNSSILVDHLKPENWTNLGIILSILKPEEQVLHILKTDADKMKGITSDHKKITLEEFVTLGQLNVPGIFSKYEKLEEIRVYTMQGLIDYYKKVQDPSIYQMDIDDYLIYMYQLQEEIEGIQIYNRTNKKRCYMEYMQLLVNRNVEDGAFLLWLTKDQELFFDCIMVFQSGKLVQLTTTDRYQEAYQDYDQVCVLLKKEYPNWAKCVKMDMIEFQSKIADLYHNEA